MANPIVKVELGSNVSVPGDVFTLDDGAKGLLAAVSTLRTNLATNPSFEASSGTVNVRTNLIINPSFELNNSFWGSGQASIIQSSNFSYNGAYSGLTTITSSADTNIATWVQTSIVSGQTYTYSTYSYVPAGSSLAGRTLSVAIEGAGATFTTVASSAATLVSGSWVRSWLTVTATSSGSFAYVHRYSGAFAVGSAIYTDAVMLEQTSVLGAYFDGSTPIIGDFTYVWSGTANASTSLQQAPQLVDWTGSNAMLPYKTTATSYVGSSSAILVNTSGATFQYAYNFPSGSRIAVTPGQTYTFTYYIKNINSTAQWYSSLAGFVASTGGGRTSYNDAGFVTPNTSIWQRVTNTWTIPAGVNYVEPWIINYTGETINGSVYVDAILFEQTSTANDYFDGNTPTVGDTVYSWTGAANLSTSIATGIVTTGVYPLAGIPFIDATSYVKTFSIGRGKSRELDRYQAGHITVKFDNTKRYFDPTFTGSPFYGQIVPRRPIRVTVKGIVQFTGIVDDWDLSFTVDGQSEAVCNANDSMAVLAQQNLSTDTYPQENTGARINRVLNSAGVVYDSIARTIDPGQMFVAAQTVDATIGALDHLQQVETSESGSLFIDKNGNVVFQDSSRVIPATTLAKFGDNNIDIGYQGMQIIYGSELLYNSANVSRTGGVTQTFVDNTSATTYGLRNIDQSTLLSDDIQTARLAAWIVQQYAQPEFRFESIDVSLGDSTVTEQSTLLKLEIGDKCQIVYTPANVPPALTKFAQIIGIDHNADPNQHIVTFHFKTLDYNLLLLDDTVYGLLDSYYLGL
jgi:hypothetical protein